MKTNRLFILAAFSTLLGLSAGFSAIAQDVGALDQRDLSDSDTLTTERQTREPSDQPAAPADTRPASQHPQKITDSELKKKVTDVNKASTFIGMDVKNLKEETLGEVNDLAFDHETGKIAYAVLSVGGFLGMNEKYIAVPLSALRPAPGAEHLLLDADKERLERAPGFAKNNWPDLDVPAWGPGAGFARGRSATSDAVGRPGQTVQQRGAASDREAVPSYFSGTISKVDQEARTVTVKGSTGEKTFTVDQTARISSGDETDAKFDALKEGAQATVEYTEKGEKPVAKWVRAQEPSSTPDESKTDEER